MYVDDVEGAKKKRWKKTKETTSEKHKACQTGFRSPAPTTAIVGINRDGTRRREKNKKMAKREAS